MKQFFYFTLGILLFNTAVHPAISQNTPVKDRIYTLQKGEAIGYNENSLKVYQSSLGYVLVIDDQAKKVRNYQVNKVNYGPFDRSTIEVPTLTEKHWGIIDSKEANHTVIFDGQATKYDYAMYPLDLKIAGDLKAYALYDQAMAEYYIVVNGEKQGPYPNLLNYYLNEDGTYWAVYYSKNVGEYYEYYLKFSDGKQLGPFSKIRNFRFLNNKSWVVETESRNYATKNVNGTEIQQILLITDKGNVGPFEKNLIGKNDYDQHNELLSNRFNYAMNVIKDQQIYYMVNGELNGPYADFITQADLGLKVNRFNYVAGPERILYFRAQKPFTNNVKKFKVSDSRATMAIVKNKDANADTLVINEKYFVGTYKNITNIQFIADTEDFTFWSKNEDNSYTLYLCKDKKTTSYGPYDVAEEGIPMLHFSPSYKYWAFSYKSPKSNLAKVVVNGEAYESTFINDVAVFKEGNEEYATWLSLDKDDIYINKLFLK